MYNFSNGMMPTLGEPADRTLSHTDSTKIKTKLQRTSWPSDSTKLTSQTKPARTKVTTGLVIGVPPIIRSVVLVCFNHMPEAGLCRSRCATKFLILHGNLSLICHPKYTLSFYTISLKNFHPFYVVYIIMKKTIAIRVFNLISFSS
jgi:hypothetical protein